MPQFRAMVQIANDPSTSLSTVAEHLALSLPTTSRIVTGLVDKGFLKRGDCAADRRQCSLGITARGQSVLNSAWSAAQESMAEELERFTPMQRAAVADAMKSMKQIFGSLGLPPIGQDKICRTMNAEGRMRAKSKGAKSNGARTDGAKSNGAKSNGAKE